MDIRSTRGKFFLMTMLTGVILSMASASTFDPSHPSDTIDLVGSTASGDPNDDSQIADEPVDEPDISPVDPPAEIVSVGDSTMALSNGRITDWYQGCRHEESAWPSLVNENTANISCSGANVGKVDGIVRKTGKIGAETHTVYITVGTNSMREGHSKERVRKDVSNLVKSVKKKAPDSRVIFVGYLQVPVDHSCMDTDDVKMATAVHSLHEWADDVMQDIARKGKHEFIDTSHLEYPICDPERTLVRLPHTTQGSAWHTTVKGHGKISEVVHEHLGDFYY